MSDSSAAKLAAGLNQLHPVLERHGFVRVGEETGNGSGGPFASATFANGERRLELWLRGDSLSVKYRVGVHELDHAMLMRELLGPAGPNRFPTHAEDAHAAFTALRHDLQCFCGDFLSGAGEEVRRCAVAAERASQLTGVQRLARTEQRLRGD
jgi:hypothetical protein